MRGSKYLIILDKDKQLGTEHFTYEVKTLSFTESFTSREAFYASNLGLVQEKAMTQAYSTFRPRVHRTSWWLVRIPLVDHCRETHCKRNEDIRRALDKLVL